jgi:hypothetical protein
MSIHRAQRLLFVVDAALLTLLAFSFVVEPYTLIERRGLDSGEETEAWRSESVAGLRSFEHYSKAIQGRTLFKSPMEEVVRASQKRLIDDYAFLGSSRLGARARGYVKNTETGETRTVTFGDRIGDYEVIEIESSSIILRKGNDTFALGR